MCWGGAAGAFRPGKEKAMEELVAKYEEIVRWVRTRIEKGELRPGDRVESEYKLCSIFQVSRQTVRHAVDVLEDDGMIERRQGSGTYVKAMVDVKEKRKKAMQVAVMTTYMQEYIFSSIIQEIESMLSKAGYTIQISFTNNTIEKERFILKNILEKNMVDGLIAEPTKSGLPNPNLDIYRKIMDKGIPVLFINSYYQELKAPYVSMNDKLAGKLATDHLLKCGHRKIAAIFKADDGQGHRRYAGYMEALMEADIQIRSRRIVWLDSDEVRHMKEDAGWILRRLEGATACVCYNDEVASGLVAVCMEQGIRVPEDLSIVGIDDSELATYCEVPLTSARNPIRDLGRIAALEMLELLKGVPVPKATELDPEIINRNSVKIIDSL